MSIRSRLAFPILMLAAFLFWLSAKIGGWTIEARLFPTHSEGRP